VLCNRYYFYLVDADLGPLFIKFCSLPDGFRNATLRTWMAQALGVSEDAYSTGRMTYDLRRLRPSA
jgi:hypothetical protein